MCNTDKLGFIVHPSEIFSKTIDIYIIKRRLSACCEAMLGGAGLAECCARCGFDNYSGFYRAFVREYGVSPSRYLRSQGVTQPAPAER